MLRRLLLVCEAPALALSTYLLAANSTGDFMAPRAAVLGKLLRHRQCILEKLLCAWLQDMYKAYQVEPHVALHAPVQARPHTKFEGAS